MDKCIVIYCDGGLGNRINSLIGGIYLAKSIKRKFQISWPINRWCGIPFEDIFNSTINADKRTILDFNSLKNNQLLIAHSSQSFSVPVVINPNQYFRASTFLSTVADNIKNYDDCIYYNNLVPDFVPIKEVLLALRHINLKDSYKATAANFLEERGMAKSHFWGLHLRGTDASSSSEYYNFWYKLSYLLPGKILLCTDDNEIENLFKKNKSVVFREKSSLPKKSETSGGWNERCVDEYGRYFDFNIARDADSMRESIVDFYLLSLSLIIPTSRSTFLSNALRYKLIYSRLSVVYEISRIVMIPYKNLKYFYRKFLKNN